MAKGKRGKGSGKSTPKGDQNGGRASNPKVFVKASDGTGAPSGAAPVKKFTLRDAAAKSSDSRASAWTPNSNLRYKSMTFVKSGDVLNDTADDGYEKTVDGPSDAAQEQTVDQPPTVSQRAEKTLASKSSLEEEQDSRAMRNIARAPSATPSNSSEEVILFTGRQNNGPKNARPEVALEEWDWDDTPGTWVDHGERAKRHRDEELFGPPQESNPRDAWEEQVPTGPAHPVQQNDSSPQAAQEYVREEHVISSLLNQARLDSENHKRSAGKAADTEKSEVTLAPMPTAKGRVKADEMLEDYIENMKDNGMLEEMMDNAVITPDDVKKNLLQRDMGGWERSELQDFNELSTSDEVFEEISQILAKRERTGEVQYLVVWPGYTPDDARWIRMSALSMHGAKEMIDSFEAEEREIAEYQAQSTKNSDEDETAREAGEVELGDESADEDAEDEWEDEDDLGTGMSDEQIARLLAKQEELGMGSDQLMIIDDDFDDEMAAGKSKTRRSGNGSSRPKRTRQEQKRKWRTTADADNGEDEDDEMFGSGEYTGFDVMDWERPSLGTGRSGPPEMDLSDSDLARTIHDTWSRDRQKKKAAKQEREELRAQGLLGLDKKTPKQKLASKYRNGFTLEDFRNDLADFLDDDDRETLELPPLDKRERKLIHEVASVFNCKSKSSGSGRSRYPVIYKTRRTVDFNDRLFDRVERKLGRQIFGGQPVKSKAARPGRSSGGRGPNGGFNYREGETVGAGASEIGTENRGRAMLEKMGWSSGTALGAMNNKGILMPIEHVVKTSRAGLG